MRGLRPADPARLAWLRPEGVPATEFAAARERLTGWVARGGASPVYEAKRRALYRVDDPELGADPKRNNAYLYAKDDARGLKCPLGAHARRMNPRDSQILGEARLHRMIRRGTFHSTAELEKAIYEWLAHWNGDPAPFAWKASADVILDKVRRCKELSRTGD